MWVDYPSDVVIPDDRDSFHQDEISSDSEHVRPFQCAPVVAPFSARMPDP